MNELSKEMLLVIVRTMSEKVEAQEAIIGDLRDHIKRDHEEMDHMQYRLTDLNQQLSSRYENHEALRTRNVELDLQVQKLTLENHMLRFNTQTPEETAVAYMVAQGASMWADGNKILTYKGVKEVTGWGLREVKDFCETYMARLENQKEESGPGTKRSSQIPAGVGTSVRKSA